MLLLLADSAIAEEYFRHLRVASVMRITTEYHLYDTAPTNMPRLSTLQVNPSFQVYHYYPGAQIFGQTVESVDMDARIVKMTDGDIKVIPREKALRTNIVVISLATGETWWGEPGSTLSNGLAIIEPNIPGKDVTASMFVGSLPTGTIHWGKSDNTNSIHLSITELDEYGGVTVETSENERITIPKATAPELMELGKQKSQQSGPAYPPQGVGSADP